MLEINKVYNEDCVGENGMCLIDDKSIDMILCDLPYGQTRNKWDSIISLDKLWEQYERIIKNDGAVVLTSTEPFTTTLINSNKALYKYKIIWVKTVGSGQMNCNFAPLKMYEEILIFSKSAACYVKDKTKAMIYNPQFKQGTPYKIKRNIQSSNTYDYQKEHEKVNDGYRYPTDVIYFPNPRIKNGHPTQKPVALFEYLIKTYSNEGDLVLDTCAGSFTTAVACINTNRNYIGFENDNTYYNLGQERLNKLLKERNDIS